MEDVQREMAKEKVFIKDHKHLTEEQKEFVVKYFDEEVESNVIPICSTTTNLCLIFVKKAFSLALQCAEKNGSTKVNTLLLKFL